MPNRRGPPLKQGSPDVQRQRELSRHRVQRFRERQRQRKIERTTAARSQQSGDLITKSPATTMNGVTTKSLAQAYIPEVTTPSDLNQKDLSCRVHFPKSIIFHVPRSISPDSSSSSLFDTSSQSLAAQALLSLSTTTTPTPYRCSTSQDLVQQHLGLAFDDDNYFNDPSDQAGPHDPGDSTFTRSPSPEDEFFDAVENQITSAVPE